LPLLLRRLVSLQMPTGHPSGQGRALHRLPLLLSGRTGAFFGGLASHWAPFAGHLGKKIINSGHGAPRARLYLRKRQHWTFLGAWAGKRGGPCTGKRGGARGGKRGGPCTGKRGGPCTGKRGGPCTGKRGGPRSTFPAPTRASYYPGAGARIPLYFHRRARSTCPVPTPAPQHRSPHLCFCSCPCPCPCSFCLCRSHCCYFCFCCCKCFCLYGCLCFCFCVGWFCCKSHRVPLGARARLYTGSLCSF
jgi:hypothetical protein